jgi:hypothetical protein
MAETPASHSARYQRIERNMRIRSFISNGHKSSPESEEQFVKDILDVMPGPLEMGKIHELRKSKVHVDEIRKLRAGMKHPSLYPLGWLPNGLMDLQMSTKPVSGQEFCLNALAFACDMGIDISTPRLKAVSLALHPRAGKDSLLGRVGSDVLANIILLSMSE